MNTENTTDREIVLSRLINAPRELVWQAWTEAERVVQWWGPNGFSNTIEEMDVRPGGVWRFIMHGPDGTDYPNLISFKEVVKPELLTYSHGDPKSPHQFEVTITFEEENGKTRLTMRSLFPTAEIRNEKIEKVGAIEGGKQTLAKLEEYMSNLEKMTMSASRILNAPREKIWEIWTEPKHMKHWYGPRDLTLTVCESDLRVGGAYRFVLLAPDGNEYSFRGIYKEVMKPSLLIYTWSFEAYPEQEATETIRFEELENNKTKLTMTTVFQSIENLDEWVKNGGYEGMNETLDRFQEVAIKY